MSELLPKFTTPVNLMVSCVGAVALVDMSREDTVRFPVTLPIAVEFNIAPSAVVFGLTNDAS